MAIYRTISMSFWTDSKVVDDFTPEDRYFYLYLFTNPHTNLCGCYEVSIKQMSYEIGYSVDSVNMLLKRFQDVHNVIRYSEKTKELLLLNWHKYNWTASEKFKKPLLKQISEVKCEQFKRYLEDLSEGKEVRYGIDTKCIDTTVTVTVTDTVSDTDTVSEIIDYLNQKAGTSFRTSSKNTQKHIKARLKEGYTLTDFKTVIDNKVKDWKGTDMSQYLRPETLFGSKFEAYLNQQQGTKKVTKFDNFTASGTDWDAVTQQIMSKQGG